MRHPASLYHRTIQPLLHLRPCLAALDSESLARRCGFLRRRPRKIPVADLLLAFFALAGESALSLERIAALVGLAAGCSYSKQALHQRLSEKLQGFLATIAVALFGQMSAPWRQEGCFKGFRRVLLHDSTVQSLPRSLAAFFPGSANQKRKTRAALKIQWICDLLSGSLVQLSYSGFRRNDQAAAPDVLGVLRQGDLVLRDLGYFSLQVLAQVQAAGAFFLSRFRHGVLIRDPKTKKPIDLLRLLQGSRHFDGWVLLGEQQHLIRLVAVPVPEEVANRRRALAKNNRDRRCVPERQRLALMDWSLFVTNVSSEVWSPKVLASIYRLRWRIEIIFKSWKSHLRLSELNCRSAELVRLSVMLKLFYCLLTASCFNSLAKAVGSKSQPSLMRFSRAWGHCGILITAVLLRLSPEELLTHYLSNHAFYENRTDRKNFPQYLKELAQA
jgi:DDE family transposase